MFQNLYNIFLSILESLLLCLTELCNQRLSEDILQVLKSLFAALKVLWWRAICCQNSRPEDLIEQRLSFDSQNLLLISTPETNCELLSGKQRRRLVKINFGMILRRPIIHFKNGSFLFWARQNYIHDTYFWLMKLVQIKGILEIYMSSNLLT